MPAPSRRPGSARRARSSAPDAFLRRVLPSHPPAGAGRASGPGGLRASEACSPARSAGTRHQAEGPGVRHDAFEAPDLRDRDFAPEWGKPVIAPPLVIERWVRPVIRFSDQTVREQALDERVKRAGAE